MPPQSADVTPPSSGTPSSGIPSGTPSSPPSPHYRNILIGTASIIVLAIALLVGVGLARSNSDRICSSVATEQGACSNGSWGPWATVSETPNTSACTLTVTDRRIYTGTRATVTGAFNFLTNQHNYSCSSSWPKWQAYGDGEIRSSYSTCQIEETRVRSANGTRSGAACVLPEISASDVRVAVEVSRAETSGAFVREEISTGTYDDFIAMIKATSTLEVVPSLVRKGDTTRVIWNSSYMNTCTVTGTNGDTWSTLVSAPEGELSSAITAQTEYTLLCKTKSGKESRQSAIVNIAPEFEEQ